MDADDRAAEVSKAIVVALIERVHPLEVADTSQATQQGEIWGAVFEAVHKKVRAAMMSG